MSTTRRNGTVTTWLNTPFRMRFQVIDGLTVRFARSEDRGDYAPLLSPWPESLLAFEEGAGDACYWQPGERR